MAKEYKEYLKNITKATEFDIGFNILEELAGWKYDDIIGLLAALSEEFADSEFDKKIIAFADWLRDTFYREDG